MINNQHRRILYEGPGHKVGARRCAGAALSLTRRQLRRRVRRRVRRQYFAKGSTHPYDSLVRTAAGRATAT